jgi:hypothetical protein
MSVLSSSVAVRMNLVVFLKGRQVDPFPILLSNDRAVV